jgi:DNA-binding protein Fis
MTSNGNLAGDMMLSAGLTLRELEKQLIERTLAQTGGNRSRAAEMLGISLRTVRNKIRDYGLPGRSAYAND